MKINMTRHTSTPDSSIKDRVPRGCMLKLVMMSKFSTNEYCGMVLIYGECGRHARAAQRLYHQRFPGGPYHSRQVVEKTVKEFWETGSVTMKSRFGRP